MKKEKKWIVFSIIIILLINYMIYINFFLPKYKEFSSKKEEYIEKEEKIITLRETENKISKIKAENEKLQKDIQILNKVTSNEIDTPQLIYDFYISCIKYSINGEEMKFDLNDDKDSEHDKKDNSKDITLDKSNIENKDISLNTKNYSKEEKYISNGIVRLSITLKVNGDKNKIEKYINSLNHITKRKLNVKSIKLSSKMDITEEEKISEKEIASNSYINDSESLDVNNIHNVKDNEVIDKEENNSILVKDDDISAEIVFYQYIKVNEENYDAIRNYDFYNKKIGFKSIADMFGSKKRSR